MVACSRHGVGPAASSTHLSGLRAWDVLLGSRHRAENILFLRSCHRVDMVMLGDEFKRLAP